ncbi:putative RNA-directed DNA polymerase from transposon X-element [Trichonephila clavipes]|nr:putative RNA-directed DNA polymerase from transposon X-element [Trichonephila clavipes]
MRLIEWQLQTAVNKLVKWCDMNGHSISASKCCCVNFCRKRVLHLDPAICIRKTSVPAFREVRFLGVIFDHRLTFLPHSLHLRRKCEKSLNILKVLSNISWGVDRTSQLRIYESIVLCRINYVFVVYGSARDSMLKRFDTVHHAALRICSDAFRTSLVQSLYVTCNQLSLDFRWNKLALTYYFKILSLPSHPLKNGNFSIGIKRNYDSRSHNIRPFMERTKLLLSELNLPGVGNLQRNILQLQPWNTPRFYYINLFTAFNKSAIAPVAF